VALTAAQQNSVVFYLGYPGKILIVGSTHYDQTVVTRMQALDANTELQVESLLTQIAAVRVKITASTSRMLVRKVGDIELNSGEHEALGRENKRLLRDLSVLLDIPCLTGSGRNVNMVQ
jgi:hypothetical protein